MKVYFFLLMLCPSLCLGQVNLTSEQWQSDLKFLQHTVHKEYPFLFKKISPQDFDQGVNELYEQIPRMQEHEIIVGLARLVSSFGYGHTAIWLSSWRKTEPFDFRQMPFQLYQFSDGIFVQGTHERYKEALGALVTHIQGVPIEQAIQKVKPAFPAENDQFFKAYGLTYLGVPEILHAQGVIENLQENLTLTLKKGSEAYEITFNAIDADKFPGAYGYIHEKGDWLDARDNTTDPLYLRNLERIYELEYLEEHNAVYVRHSQIQDDENENIPAFYDRVFSFIRDKHVDRMVLDLRLNGGGNNYKNKPIVTGIIKSENINQTGNLFVILGRRTFSACQNLVNELSNYTNAIFVGEPTGENINFYGDNRLVNLPHSKLPVRLSFAWWQDKPQWENGPWMAPHIAVDLSFNDYISNRDPVLERALKFSNEEFILDPMAYFTDLYFAGESEKIMSEAKRMLADPSYRFFDFEGQFNRAGYNLLGNGQVNEAISVFGMVVQLFPESANARDSMGEAYWKAGQTEKAIDFYNQAIKLDPDGSVGENAKMMLERIQTKK